MCYEFGIVNKSLYFLDKPSCSKTLALVLQIATARVIINLLELYWNFKITEEDHILVKRKKRDDKTEIY